jgi:hypothetical protein
VRLVPGVVLGLVLLTSPAGADAKQRYAAPNGTGEVCTQAAPCTLADAVDEASEGDEVIVGGGDYQVTGTPINVVDGGLRIHGDLGGPMPRISAQLGGLPAIRVNAAGATLSYLDVINEETEGVGVDCLSQSQVERVSALGIGEGAAGLRQFRGCLVRDSLLRGRGTNSIGMESLAIEAGEPVAVARNLTAIATGENSVGIQSRYSNSGEGHHTLLLSNSIARGGAFDLRADDSLAGPGNITVSNSNFNTISEKGAAALSGAANQNSTPLFLNPAAGDYREAPGSPTIDAGSVEGLGPLDLGGNPRLLGPAPDIGAFEFVPPPPPVAAPALTSLSVSPRSFRARSAGEAIVSRARRGKRAGATVRYGLTAVASVGFTVERALMGRRVGGRCRKQTTANRGRKRCTRFRAIRGTFSLQGVTGANAFRFSGRLGGRALKPGRYRLVAKAGASVKRAGFRISG